MKKTIHLFLVAGLVLVSLFSCMKQDDIYKDFVVPGGLQDPQRVDTLIVKNGFGKVQLIWPKAIDPLVVKTRIYWNNRQDSIDVDMAAVEDSARIIIDNLLEESYTFTAVTFDAKGNKSVDVEAVGNPYGTIYINSKSPREVKTAAMLTSTVANFTFSNATADLAYSEFKYTSTSGEEKTVVLDTETNKLQVDDYDNSKPYAFRSVFMPENGFEAVSSEWSESEGELSIEVVDFPKQYWRLVTLPGDQWMGSFGTSIQALWNNSAGDIWASQQWVDPRNTYFTLDLGYSVSLAEVQLWHRVPYETYDGSGIRNFQIWGSMEPNPDGSWDSWTLLGEFQAYKPSGFLPNGLPGPVTAEDNDYWINHNVFKFVPTDKTPNPGMRVRYIRVNLQEAFVTYQKELNGETPYNDIFVFAEITFRGSFGSLEERNQFMN